MALRNLNPVGIPLLWRPKFKPQPAQLFQFDPQGVLSGSLQSLILFEHCAAPGFIDYARPWNKLTLSGTTGAATPSRYGGQAYSSSGQTLDSVNFGSALASTSIWSFSSLIRFDGTGAGGLAGSVAPVTDVNTAPTTGVFVAGGNDQFCDFTSSHFLTPVITTFSTWTRCTFTSDGTNVSLYVNGVSQSSAAFSPIAIPLGSIFSGWPWPAADFFWWSAQLSGAQVLAHAQDPYGTTMRPKMEEWTVKGTAAATTKKSGLLLQGVGP